MTLRNQSGQMILETILILVILFSATVLTASQLKRAEFFSSIVSGPWVRLAGMIQNGAWVPPNQGISAHPSNHPTSMSPE